MEFWKMHGAGNDFIIVDNRENRMAAGRGQKAELAALLCHRHFGIGADGVIFAERSENGLFRMSFYNSDGSEATMCGNGIRCYAKYLFDRGIVTDPVFDIETGDGVKQVQIIDNGAAESIVKVKMGKWDNNLIEFDLHVTDRTFTLSFLHVGVPHAILFIEEAIEDLEAFILKYGPLIEKNPVFKEGTNVNFVRISDPEHITVDTWERGAGRTLACGTGASASAIVAHRLKGKASTITASMPGGAVRITLLEDDTIYMEGPARTICKGTYIL